MGPYYTRFQIRDLEEFSGVKAHTIRIWEKRYGLLAPDRSTTNIRSYGLEELKTILNVSYLTQNGYRISAIAAMPADQRERLVQEVSAKAGNGGDVINTLKMAMLSFDEVLFDSASGNFERTHGFRALVERIYVPLLEHIGVLWQTNSICPAQEHFVSNIIRHKLIVATYGLPPASGATAHVLYLPADEIHELGLLYLNYILRSKGERTIYLGQSVPMDDLRQVAALHDGPMVFVSVLMAHPPASEIPAYLRQLRATVPSERATFWVTGSQLSRIETPDVPPGVRLFPSMLSVITALNEKV